MIDNEEIEVLDDDFEKVDDNNENIETLEINKESTPQENSVISLDTLFQDEKEEVIDVYEEEKQIEEKKQKTITKIQIGLIVFLVVFATLFYFFGYDLVEPYIKIE